MQRSVDNIEFSTIGLVQAAGTAYLENRYAFTDEAPFTGANYYRLHQVDTDGSGRYSPSVVAHIMGNGRPSIFPNPATDHLNIAGLSFSGTAEVQIRDALGRVASQHTWTMGTIAENNGSFPLSGLAKGWYNLHIVLPDGQVVRTDPFLKD